MTWLWRLWEWRWFPLCLLIGHDVTAWIVYTESGIPEDYEIYCRRCPSDLR